MSGECEICGDELKCPCIICQDGLTWNENIEDCTDFIDKLKKIALRRMCEMENTISIPPPNLPLFDRYLLDPLLGMFMRVENKIKPLEKKKVRDIDIGKKREFLFLIKKFNEEYERKKIEKAQYDQKIKDAPKRSIISNASSTCRFTRF